MKLETEFKFRHGDILCLTCDPQQSMLLTVLRLEADVCPAGVIQRHYECRAAWRTMERAWASKGSEYVGIKGVDRQYVTYHECELVAYDPDKDPVAVDPLAELKESIAARAKEKE